MRARNPCLRFRRRFLGWYVRFMTSVLTGEDYGGATVMSMFPVVFFAAKSRPRHLGEENKCCRRTARRSTAGAAGARPRETASLFDSSAAPSLPRSKGAEIDCCRRNKAIGPPAPPAPGPEKPRFTLDLLRRSLLRHCQPFRRAAGARTSSADLSPSFWGKLARCEVRRMGAGGHERGDGPSTAGGRLKAGSWWLEADLPRTANDFLDQRKPDSSKRVVSRES